MSSRHEAKINKKNDEALATTSNILKQLNQVSCCQAQRPNQINQIIKGTFQTEAGATATLTELADQGEKLNRIEDNLDVVNQDLKEADKAITSMDGGCLGGLFRQRNFQLKSKSPEKGGSKVSKLRKEGGCNSAPNGPTGYKFCI